MLPNFIREVIQSMLNYYNITIGDKEYKCKLTTASIVECEEKLGVNLLQIFFNMRVGQLPTVKQMVTIFHHSLQAYNHEIKLSDSYELFDKWLENHQIMQFVAEMVEIFKVSGIIRLDEESSEETSKN